MYLGDLHHGFEYQFLKAKDMPGVEVEYLRTVGTTDSWHEDFGWIGIPKTAYLQVVIPHNSLASVAIIKGSCAILDFSLSP